MEYENAFGSLSEDSSGRIRFKFLSVPIAFFVDEKPDGLPELSVSEVVLYSLMLNRSRMSIEKGDLFRDSYGRVYIIYTIEEIMRTIRCSKPKAILMLKNLRSRGFIRIERMGRNKPNRIYVKNFDNILESLSKVSENSSKSNFFTSTGKNSLPPQVKKIDPRKNTLEREIYKEDNIMYLQPDTEIEEDVDVYEDVAGSDCFLNESKNVYVRFDSADELIPESEPVGDSGGEFEGEPEVNVEPKNEVDVEDKQEVKAEVKTEETKKKKASSKVPAFMKNVAMAKPEGRQSFENSVAFEDWWKVYPRHDMKKKAWLCYQRLVYKEKEITEEQALNCAKGYVADCKKKKTDPKYMMMPSTFLSYQNRPFEDYIEYSETKKASAKEDVKVVGVEVDSINRSVKFLLENNSYLMNKNGKPSIARTSPDGKYRANDGTIWCSDYYGNTVKCNFDPELVTYAIKDGKVIGINKMSHPVCNRKGDIVSMPLAEDGTYTCKSGIYKGSTWHLDSSGKTVCDNPPAKAKEVVRSARLEYGELFDKKGIYLPF